MQSKITLGSLTESLFIFIILECIVNFVYKQGNDRHSNRKIPLNFN